MRDEEDGPGPRLTSEQRDDVDRCLVVESARRLVGEEDERVAGGRTDDGEHPLHRLWKRDHLGLEHVGERGESAVQQERARDRRLSSTLEAGAVRQRGNEVLAHGAHEEARVLQHQPDAPPRGGRAVLAQWRALQLGDPPCREGRVGIVDTRERAEQRRLPRAGGPHEDDEPGRGEREVDVGEHRCAVEGETEAAEAEDGRGVSHFATRGGASAAC